jgi:glycosyltransferase involved in cell wall biosynthesis
MNPLRGRYPMKIFLSVTSFRREYGGPAVSVTRLGAVLARCGLDVGLWAPDGSAKDVTLCEAQTSLRLLSGSAREAISSFGRPDVIHDNGLWRPHNHYLAQFARWNDVTRVVSLRGMLEPGALRFKKWKKRIAWVIYQRRDIECATILHATAQEESNNAKALGLTPLISVIPNGVDLPKHCLISNGLRPKEKRVALFVSRLHPVKGLPMLLRAWATIHPPKWELRIVGPAEGNHEAEIRQLVRQLGLSDHVSLLGPVYGAEKEYLYRTADIFVLPTHSENFGNVIAEALSYGVPVLTTRGAPWELLKTHECGWWVDASVHGIYHGLMEAINQSDIERKEMGRRGAVLVSELFNWDAVAGKFIAMYKELAGFETRYE